MTIQLRRCGPTTSDYAAAWELRRRVLLDPFGISHDEARGDDAEATHLGLFDEHQMGSGCLACLLLVSEGETTVRMRQVAVRPECQRRGLGRRLVRAAEAVAKAEGFTLMTAHAREPALPFYRSLGYRVVGEAFLEVGIVHRMVRRTLD